MSDPLREAAERLRDLRSDVDRLKSGERFGGVLRVLRRVSETTTTDDTVETGPSAAVDDTTVAADTVATGPDAAVDETTSASDATSTTTAAVEKAAWNEAAWEEDYSD